MYKCNVCGHAHYTFMHARTIVHERMLIVQHVPRVCMHMYIRVPIAIMVNYQVSYFLTYFRCILPYCEKLPHAKFQVDQLIYI